MNFESNNSANFTEMEYSIPDSVTYSLIGLYSIVSCVSLIGNCIIILLFILHKPVQTKANYFHAALAVCDVLLVGFCVPFTVFTNVVNYHWIFGPVLCSTIRYIQTVCVIQRSFTLVASSIDRHYAVRRPFRRQLSRTKITCISVIICIASMLIPIPTAHFSQILYDVSDNASGVCLDVWPSEDTRHMFNITLLVVAYILPLLVLIVTYMHIIIILDEKPPGEVYEALLRKRRTVKRKVCIILMVSGIIYTNNHINYAVIHKTCIHCL